MAGVQEPATDTPLSEKREKYIVAALDFGTTYSGYAYSFKHDFKKDPTLHIGKPLFPFLHKYQFHLHHKVYEDEVKERAQI